MFVKINGEHHYLWRAVDHEGEVLESFVTKKRDKKAALKFLKKSLKRHGAADEFVTDRLRSYGAALGDLGIRERQKTGRWMNNRAENSHLPFRRRERAMLRFRRLRTLQEFASDHDEGARQAACVRDRFAPLVWRRAEGNRCGRSAGNRPLGKQSRREFTPAIPTTRAGHATVSQDAKFADVRLRPRFGPQSYQPETSPLLPTEFNAQPRRRPHRVAPALFRISSGSSANTETG